ncbi:hypothetical protein D8B24_20595, partial [Verminephrobacter aporrectodeae subsp. tuberculatae]|uniref:SwmB domain-containing protein n=1 Tax=Verminephrobacter aporrectodeae TaxID=1110389 RepID=UPI0022449C24
PADTTAPEISTTTVTGDQLVLTYTEANSLNGAALTGNAGFTVESLTVDTGATTIPVNSAVVNGAAKTVTLTLSRAVVYGELVRVSYAKPATGNRVQDAAGNAAENFSDRDVVNDTRDTAAPQLITTGNDRPKITDGIYLVLHFSDASPSLDDSNGPAKEDFTVFVDGVAKTVTEVTMGGMSKAVLLTLSTSVESGQRVTVAYQDNTPGNNGIQDPTGNRLLSIPTTVVMNDTIAPQLITTGDTTRPKVNGNQLVLSFTDTSDLDADPTHTPANGAFTVLVNGVANAVTNVTVEPQAKTVTLTLTTAVTSGQSVTVAYADPTTDDDANAMQDAAGNDAASFAATAVTNNTPAPADTAAPQLIITGDSRPKVTGDQLVLSFSDTGNLDADAAHKPANGAFTVLINGVANAVTSVAIEPQAKTVTLTLATAVTSDQSVTVAYADPTTGNDANAIQDTAGNDTASFAATAVTNNTPAPADTTAPALIITGDSRPKVTGDQLVLSFSDTGNLDADASHKPASGAFTVMVNGVANAVTSVTVEPQAKTVTLTLSTAVTNDQTVTVAYADPTTGNDANAIQDATGNDAASFAATAVTNNTPAAADVTAPQLIITGDSRPKVTGDQLVLSFSDTGNLDADPIHTPANGAFTVLVDSVANAVTNVAINAEAKTVTLTLTTAVTSDQTVTVAYADPTTGNDANAIQDATGNDTASFAATAVTNNTPAPADTTAPALIITGDSRPKVTGDQLVLSFSDTGNLDADLAHKPANEAFTVLVNGVANAVTNVTIEPQAKTVTLTLTTAVTSDQTVTVAYADPTTGNDANAIQDAAGNDATSFAATAVTNNTPAPADTAAPALIITGDSRPKVTGDQLVLSFSDTGNLDADAGHKPAGGAFTVLVNSVANAVTNVAINAEAKTVTLTLSTAVTSGQSVTVAYADPTTGNDANAIQDAAGNDAASFAATAVTNNTPAPADTTAPALIITGDSRPKVNGNQLVLSFNDTGNLDADPTHTPANGAFTVLVDGVANAVTNVTVEPQAKTVTLTLATAVTSDQSVTVAYADPTTGNDANAIQDAAGNDTASFAATAVTNNTPAPADTTAPALIITGDSRPKVTGDQLVLSFSDTGNLDADASHKPASGAFTVLVNGIANAVTNVTVEPQAKTVTLTLSTAVTHDQTVTVAYADPTTGNDANAIQDAAGNDATSFAATAVTNNTPAPADTTAPALIITGDSRPKVTGDQLVLSFSDTGNLDADASHKPASGAFTVLVNGVANAVTNVAIEPQAKTVTLTLTTAVTSDQTVTVAYADPTTGNDANAIQDATGNDTASFAATAVTNNTPAPADTTAPALIITGDSRPKVTGDQLVLSFSDTGNLDADASHKPASGAFTVLVNGIANAVTNVTVDSQAKTVTLTLSTAVTSDQTVTVAYADPTTGNDANAIQDATGNDTASFAATAVTNNTPAAADVTAPQLIITGDSRPKVTGDQLVLSFSDTGNLDANASHKPASGAFTVLVNGVANAVTSVAIEPQAKTVTLTLTTAVTSDQTITVAYADPTTGNDANAIQDAAGNDATSFAATAVTNNTPAAADATAPQLIITGDSRPKVTGDQLVLSFSDTGNLDADAAHKPASGAFTVLVNGVANAVTNVTVEPQAKTVTLTLTTAITHGQTVTVAYADPTTGNDANAIQDAAGNDAASFAATAVTNNTPAPADTTAPALIITGDTTRPKVNGNQLVLSFSDTGNLDADPTHTPANGAFTVMVNGVANAVTNVTVEPQAKTVTLTLTTAVTHDQTVTVAYADPTTGNDANAIQDAAGNDAASFAATAVTNNTPAPADTAAPQLIITGDTTRPKVNGNQLVLSFSDTGNLDADPTHTPANGAFTVMVNGVANAVTNVTVEPQAKTVTLTLTTAVTSDQTVTVAYADPTTGNDAN